MVTVADALLELEFLRHAAQRKADRKRAGGNRRETRETRDRIIAAYERERDALAMAIDALKAQILND